MAEKIDVRWGEKLLPTELIRPHQVEDLVAEITHGLPEEEAVIACWDWVCKKIIYPLDAKGRPTDHHYLAAFLKADIPFLGRDYRIKRSTEDFWQYPAETLGWGCYGDCEDKSILLCSLLRAYGIDAERVKVVVGDIPGGPHAWVQLDGHILETTLPAVPNPAFRSYPEYVALGAFNDMMTEGQVRPPAKGDERGKLKYIGALWKSPHKGS